MTEKQNILHKILITKLLNRNNVLHNHLSIEKKSFKMKETTKYLLWVFAVVSLLIACSSNEEGETPADNFDVRFELPATVDVTKGGELTFTVKEGKSPLTTDSFILEGGGNFLPLSHSQRIF